MILHDWDMSFEKFEGLPTVVVFKKINFEGRDKIFFKIWAPNEFGEMPHVNGHSVKNAITIKWSQVQSVVNKPLKLSLICSCGLLLLVAICQEN